MSKFEQSLELYKQAIESISGMELKGKTIPYTSANGHMFSQLNKDGELGIRLSKEDREVFYEKHGEEPFLSYGAVMKEYVKIPNSIMSNQKKLAIYLTLANQYVLSLKKK